MRDFLRWFLLPSGGPVKPGVLGFLDGIKRRPIVAHPGGGALMALLFCVAGFPEAALLAAALGEGVNQFYKTTSGAYGARWPFEVFARLFFAVCGAAIVVLVW